MTLIVSLIWLLSIWWNDIWPPSLAKLRIIASLIIIYLSLVRVSSPNPWFRNILNVNLYLSKASCKVFMAHYKKISMVVLASMKLLWEKNILRNFSSRTFQFVMLVLVDANINIFLFLSGMRKKSQEYKLTSFFFLWSTSAKYLKTIC